MIWESSFAASDVLTDFLWPAVLGPSQATSLRRSPRSRVIPVRFWPLFRWSWVCQAGNLKGWVSFVFGWFLRYVDTCWYVGLMLRWFINPCVREVNARQSWVPFWFFDASDLMNIQIFLVLQRIQTLGLRRLLVLRWNAGFKWLRVCGECGIGRLGTGHNDGVLAESSRVFKCLLNHFQF